MKHKEGDVVRIRSKEWMEANKTDKDNGILPPDNYYSYIIPDMFRYAGRTAEIVNLSLRGGYSLNIDHGGYNWEDWMFDPDYRADGPLAAEEAIRAMLDGNTLTDDEGTEYFWNADWNGGAFVYRKSNETSTGLANFYTGLYYRLPAKRKRLMTRFEILGWANSEESRGWVVRIYEEGDWHTPQFVGYTFELDNYQRARLLPDCSGVDEDTIQGFEVEE